MERSLQEDALLVLFSTAVSNLVRQLYSEKDLSLRSNRSFSATIMRSDGISVVYSGHSSPVHLS